MKEGEGKEGGGGARTGRLPEERKNGVSSEQYERKGESADSLLLYGCSYLREEKEAKARRRKGVGWSLVVSSNEISTSSFPFFHPSTSLLRFFLSPSCLLLDRSVRELVSTSCSLRSLMLGFPLAVFVTGNANKLKEVSLIFFSFSPRYEPHSLSPPSYLILSYPIRSKRSFQLAHPESKSPLKRSTIVSSVSSSFPRLSPPSLELTYFHSSLVLLSQCPRSKERPSKSPKPNAEPQLSRFVPPLPHHPLRRARPSFIKAQPPFLPPSLPFLRSEALASQKIPLSLSEL